VFVLQFLLENLVFVIRQFSLPVTLLIISHHLASVKMSLTVLFIGGTGAQGSAVVKALLTDPKFHLKLLTRDTTSPEATELASMSSQVSLIQGDCFDERTLFKQLGSVDSCFVNTQGFAIGEKAEVYWGIRMYEIALWAGVKHFVWGGIDYCGKKAGFDPKYHCGHYDGKGKVQGQLDICL
jgi:hypothetical protein